MTSGSVACEAGVLLSEPLHQFSHFVFIGLQKLGNISKIIAYVLSTSVVKSQFH
jgi:hypothetical protein